MQPGGVDWDSMDWEEAAPGAREKVVSQADRRLRLLELSDTFHEEEWCTADHLGMVIEGAVMLKQPGPGDTVIDQRLVAGQGIVLPAGSPHKGWVEDGGHAVLVLVEHLTPTP